MLVVLWDWGIGGTFAAVVDVLSDVHDTFILTQIFKVDKTTICRTIRHVTPLTEQIWKIKQERLLSENDVQLLIVGTTEQRIERPKESVRLLLRQDPCTHHQNRSCHRSKGRILHVSKPYEDLVYDFKIHQSEGPHFLLFQS